MEGVPIARVKVLADGRILLEDEEVTLHEIRSAFDVLGRNGGAVWYYREGGHEDPTAEAMQVIEAIVEAQLPVRLFTKPDFSEWLRPQDLGE